MRSTPLMVRVVIVLAMIGLLAVLRFKPWQPAATRQGVTSDGVARAGGREHLTVGFLPVT